MAQFLIIPTIDSLHDSIALSKKYNAGFEFNDFYPPWILDDEKRIDEMAEKYNSTPNMPKSNTMHGAFFDVLIFSDDERIKEISRLRVRQSMEVASKLGCKGVVFHGNINPFLIEAAVGEIYEKNWLDNHVSFYTKICHDFPNLQIYIENMFDRTPDNLALLGKEMVGVPNFGICFDYAHAHITDTDTKIWAEKLSPYIKHVHINDNDGKSDLHQALGDGITDWNKFFDLRKSLFPDATVLIETGKIENQRKSFEFLENAGQIQGQDN